MFFHNMTLLNSRRRGISKLLLSSSLFPWVAADSMLVFLSFNFFARFGRNGHQPEIQRENLIAALALAAFFALFGIALGFFERESRLRKLNIVQMGGLAWLGALASSITILHFAFFMKLGRYSLIYGGAASIIAVFGFHFFMAWLLRNYPHRFVIVGDLTPTSHELLSAGTHSRREHLEHVSALRKKIFEDENISLEEVARLIEEDFVSDLVLTSSPAHRDRMASLATIALQKGLRVLDEGRFYGEIFRRYPLENLSTNWIIHAGFDIHKPMTNALKRVFDFVFALITLILFSPLFLIIGLLIKLNSKGPVLYTQVRQGRYSNSFRMVKFRTMKIREANSAGSDATAPQDDRITGIGKMLRPLHIDELPQLWNILMGDMAFVGPRPEALSVVESTRKQLPVFEIRHMLRPGLTGWAQISQGKTMDGFDEVRRKLSFDLYYVKNYGLIFDVLIVLRTVFVLTKKNW